MEDYYSDEIYREDTYSTVYEVLDSFDHRFVTDTENYDEATRYQDRGYFINEHRIQKMVAKDGIRSTLVITLEW